MAKLNYTAITSLDGYIEDADGRFDWATPDEDVHTFANDLERPVRRLGHAKRERQGSSPAYKHRGVEIRS